MIPETAATSLAAPLERRFGQIAGVTELTSNSYLGGASLTLQFDLDRSIEGAARDVQAAINAAGGELPAILPNPPTYRKVNPADSPVMILGLTSDTVPLADVYNLADQVLGQRISQVAGVSQVNIGGGAQSAVRIQVNPAVLASMGLSMESIRSAVSQVNVDSPKGMITSGRESYVISSNDQLYEAKEYRPLIVAQHDGVPVRLGAIARVIDAQNNVQNAGWSGTRRAVLLVRAQAGHGERHPDRRPDPRAAPPVAALAAPGGQARGHQRPYARPSGRRWHDVQTTLLISVGLVVAVMFIFLRRLWPTFIAGVTVPLSLAGTFGVMYVLGYSLDNLSLMALTVSVGFVVDDAIVVIENIVRFIELGDHPLDAALKGARQIGFTVVSISLSLIAVFIPILFMGGLIGRVFHEFAVTLSVAILVSALISLTLTPMLCARFLKAEHPDRGGGWFYETTERFFNGLLGGYERGLRWVLRHQRFTLLVTSLTLVATVMLYVTIPKGFFPQQDTGLMVGFSEGGQDIPFEWMVKKHKQVTDIVVRRPGRGQPGRLRGRLLAEQRVHVHRPQAPERARRDGRRGDRPACARNWRKVPGVALYLQAAQDLRVGGRTGRSQYQYTLESSNLEDLRHWTPLLLEKLRHVPSIKDVNTDQQANGLQETVVVNRDAAARLGIQPQSGRRHALQCVRTTAGVDHLHPAINEYRVVLEADPGAFNRKPVHSTSIFVHWRPLDRPCRCSTIAHYEMTNTLAVRQSPGAVSGRHLTFNVAPGVSLGQATLIIEQAQAGTRNARVNPRGFPGQRQGVPGDPRTHAAAAARSRRSSRSTSSSACSTRVSSIR